MKNPQITKSFSEPQQRLIALHAANEFIAGEVRDEFIEALQEKTQALGFKLHENIFVHCDIIPPKYRSGEWTILAKFSLSATATAKKADSMELHDFLDSVSEKSAGPEL